MWIRNTGMKPEETLIFFAKSALCSPRSQKRFLKNFRVREQENVFYKYGLLLS